MRKVFDEIIAGVHIRGLAEVEPAELATDIDPPWPAIVTVYEVYVEPYKQCLEIIDPAVIQRIEKMIAEDL